MTCHGTSVRGQPFSYTAYGSEINGGLPLLILVNFFDGYVYNEDQGEGEGDIQIVGRYTGPLPCPLTSMDVRLQSSVRYYGLAETDDYFGAPSVYYGPKKYEYDYNYGRLTD